MKLNRANERSLKRTGAALLQKGDTYRAAGRSYRVVSVKSSNVTVEPIPTALERVGSFFRSIAAPYRWAMRRRRTVATITTPAPDSPILPRDRSRQQRKAAARARSGL
jgi:Lhr-like helicase